MKKTIKLKIKGIKGEKGDTPSKDELVSIITPLIPEPIKGEKGEKPTTDELIEIITPLIPEPLKGEAGHTPTEEEIASIIKPLIPKPIKGDKGDSGKDVDENVIKDIQAKVNRALDISSRDYDFTELLDVPNSYSGQAGKFPKVKATEDGLEFADVATATPSLQQVTDVGASTTVESTFSSGIVTPQVKASTSAGLDLKADNGTDIGRLGAGNTANVSWYGSHIFSLMSEGSVAYFGANGLLSQDADRFRYRSDVTSLDVFRTFTERVTNGNFTGSSTGWTVPTGWAYSSNSVSKTSNGTGALSQAVPVYNGGYYRFTFTISNYTTGTVTPSIGGVTLTARSANGTYTEYFTALNNSSLAFTPSNTARFTIDSVSCGELSGGSVQSGNLYTRELVIGNSSSNTNPGTTRHISLKSNGSTAYIDAYFGNTLSGALRFDTSQNINAYMGSASSFQWYTGLSSPSLSAYLTSSIFAHYGQVAGLAGVSAGNTGTTQPATLTSWKSIGFKHTIIVENTELTDQYTYVDVFPDNSATCGGTPTYNCSHWTTESDCALRDAHGGCSWSGGECSIYNGDESGCTTNPDCTWETASCAGFGDESSCLSYSGCSWGNNPQPCSIYDTDQSSCEATYGCTWSYTDCASSFYDEVSCNSQSGCSWDSMSSVCTGSYNTSCYGSYDQYSCTGDYATGNCTGSFGNCNGTSNCGGIDDSTSCGGESGCSWTTGLTLTLPPESSFTTNFLRTYFIRNQGATGNVTVIPNTSQTVNGTSSVTIGPGKARHVSLAYHQVPCYVWSGTDSTTCTTGHSGCTWTACAPLDEATCISTGGQCVWDSDNSVCSGVGNCDGTWNAIRDWSVYGGVF